MESLVARRPEPMEESVSWVDVLELGTRQQQQELESQVSTQDRVHRHCVTRSHSRLEMEAAAGGQSP